MKKEKEGEEEKGEGEKEEKKKERTCFGTSGNLDWSKLLFLGNVLTKGLSTSSLETVVVCNDLGSFLTRNPPFKRKKRNE